MIHNKIHSMPSDDDLPILLILQFSDVKNILVNRLLYLGWPMTFEDLHVIGRERHLVNINMKTPNRPFYFEKKHSL